MAEPYFDFIEHKNGWTVFGHSSSFVFGVVEWSDDKKKYDFVGNSNANLMGVTRDGNMREELRRFCDARTKEREEVGGNK